MRRAATWIMLALTTLLLTAVPALATEGEGGGAGGDYFGAGQWDGMLLAGLLGVVLGAVIVSTIKDDTESDHDAGEHGQH